MAKKEKVVEAPGKLGDIRSWERRVPWVDRSVIPCPDPRCGSPETIVTCSRDAIRYMRCKKCELRFQAIDFGQEEILEAKRRQQRLESALGGVDYWKQVVAGRQQAHATTSQAVRDAIKGLELAKAELAAAEKAMQVTPRGAE